MAIRPNAKSLAKVPLRGIFWVGILAALIAGFGQGTGAVVSRKAEAVLWRSERADRHHRGVSARRRGSPLFRVGGPADPALRLGPRSGKPGGRRSTEGRPLAARRGVCSVR